MDPRGQVLSALYAESSAVVRWLLQERDVPDILRALAEATTVIASVLTLAEAGRVLSRLTTAGTISSEKRAAGMALLAEAAAGWTVRAITDDVLARVSEPFPVEPVRTLDAIHLATASLLAVELGPLAVLSTDERIRRNARAMGLAVVPPNP